MPKRRVTSARRRQIELWQLAGLRARLGKSHPDVHTLRNKIAYKAGELKHTPPGLGGRRSKMGGKAYTHKTAGNFTPHPEVGDLMSGKTTFAQTTAAHASSGIDHNGPGLAASPRGGGHKIAPKPPKSTRKPPGSTANLQHGSGTGLTSAYRYLPVNVAARKRKYKKGK
jgi:hypothetical protein